MRELLRQRQPGGFQQERRALQQAAQNAAQAPDPSNLNGIEGAATHAYFQALAQTIPAAYEFGGRNRRPLRYGERVQRSVFEIVVRDRRDLDSLREELRTLVGTDDNVRFYRLCAACRQSSNALDGSALANPPTAVIL